MSRAGRNRPPVPRSTETFETLGPIEPGRCNYCGGPLPADVRRDTVTCSKACAKDWDNLITSTGRQMAVRALYAQHASKGARFYGLSAFSEMMAMARALHARWKAARGLFDAD
ncbi:MAG: hypothetical protein AAFR79_16100 [Pseudomonadota bacterium]